MYTILKKKKNFNDDWFWLNWRNKSGDLSDWCQANLLLAFSKYDDSKKQQEFSRSRLGNGLKPLNGHLTVDIYVPYNSSSVFTTSVVPFLSSSVENETFLARDEVDSCIKLMMSSIWIHRVNFPVHFSHSSAL